MNKVADYSLTLASCIALVFCILNPYHLTPGLDIFHSSFIAIILAVGLLFFFKNKPTLFFPKSSWTWVGLLLLILIQPLINTIFYPDALVFPFGNLLICILFSVAIASLSNTQIFIKYFLYTLILCMLVSTLIQLLQFNDISIEDGYLIVMKMQGRFDGNFFQPNQLSFMTALSLVALIYLYYKDKEKKISQRKNDWLFAIIFVILSFSIGLTFSRGGLILAIAGILGYGLCYLQPVKQRFINTIFFLGLFTLGYCLAIWSFEKFYLPFHDTSMGELARTESIYIRSSLQERAIDLFKINPLTGVGWHNYSYGSISEATSLKWYIYSEHSHLIFTQIASELGILGLLTLIPIIVLIFRKFSLQHTNLNSFLYISIGLFILYSLSEYPLWYLRFLYIFVIYIALIDNNKVSINFNFNKLFSVLSFTIAGLSIFYMVQFVKMYKVIQNIENGEISSIEKFKAYKEWDVPFGYSGFKESVLFSILPVDKNQLNQKLEIGNRALTVAISKKALFKQGQLLTLAGKDDQALVKYKAACALEWKDNCEDVVNTLHQMNSTQPEIYGNVTKQFEQWEKNFKPR